MEYPKLKKAPIAEAIVDWNGVVPAEWKMGEVKDTLLTILRQDFPHYQEKNVIEANVFFPPNASPELAAGSPQEIFAHQFWNEKRTRLVQYRKDGFSFNMLPPYTTFEDEMPLMRKEWERYQALVPDFQLKEVKLRFINRIVLPMSEEFLDWGMYFTIGEDTKGVPQGFQNFMKSNQSAWQNPLKSQAVVRVIFLENVVPKEVARIIFDIEAIQANLSHGDGSWERVETILSDLRDLKNQAFFGGLTESCIQTFQ